VRGCPAALDRSDDQHPRPGKAQQGWFASRGRVDRLGRRTDDSFSKRRGYVRGDGPGGSSRVTYRGRYVPARKDCKLQRHLTPANLCKRIVVFFFKNMISREYIVILYTIEYP
jgi:hypothetical protein